MTIVFSRGTVSMAQCKLADGSVLQFLSLGRTEWGEITVWQTVWRTYYMLWWWCYLLVVLGAAVVYSLACSSCGIFSSRGERSRPSNSTCWRVQPVPQPQRPFYVSCGLEIQTTKLSVSSQTALHNGGSLNHFMQYRLWGLFKLIQLSDLSSIPKSDFLSF